MTYASKTGRVEWLCIWVGIQESTHPLCLTDSSKAINHHIHFQDVNKSTFSIASFFFFFLGTWHYPSYLLLQHKLNTKNVCLKRVTRLKPASFLEIVSVFRLNFFACSYRNRDVFAASKFFKRFLCSAILIVANAVLRPHRCIKLISTRRSNVHKGAYAR